MARNNATSVLARKWLAELCLGLSNSSPRCVVPAGAGATLGCLATGKTTSSNQGRIPLVFLQASLQTTLAATHIFTGAHAYQKRPTGVTLPSVATAQLLRVDRGV